MKRKTVFLLVLTIMAISIGVIIIKMFTLDIEVELVQTVKIPSLPVISEMPPGDYRGKAIAIDGKIIQGTNSTPQPTASTAKMILGLAIMEKKPFKQGETGENITITPEFFNHYLWYRTHNGSTTAVVMGEVISEYDALASVFLASSNNMADTLATWAFGSLEEYQAYATDLIARLGLNNTTIGVDASGYSETTTSTAEDLSRAAGELLKDPILKEIVRLKSHTVPVVGEIQNTNKILGEALNNDTSVIGVKTGYIGDASGYNLISAYEEEGHFVTLSVLGASTRETSFVESKNELLRLSEELTPTTVVSEGEAVGYYQTWWNGRHDITARETIRVLAPAGDDDVIELSDQGITATINGEEYTSQTEVEPFSNSPSLIERFLHIFGWSVN